MKKVIIIASSVLVFVLLIFLVLSRKSLSPNTNNQSLITPTLVEVDTLRQQNQQIINNALPLTPYEDENFRFDYSSTLDRLVVDEKTPQAKEKFYQWAVDNGLSELAGNPEVVVFETSPTSTLQLPNSSPVTSNQSPSFDPLIEFLNIFLNFGRGAGSSSINNQNSPTSNVQLPNPTSNLQSPTSNSFIYFAQCNSEFADLSLPNGCNLCQAGCGPSTVAMIGSSYLGNSFDPKTIVDMYKARGYLLGCEGSRYSDAKAVLQSLGLKTTDFIDFNYQPADLVVNDLKKYLNAGWTFFTLASFRDTGGGHFFWITSVDSQNNIWAYDPYYGRFQAPPLNENDRYPFPKYRIAFGVKK